jgi:hypothetical protein
MKIVETVAFVLVIVTFFWALSTDPVKPEPLRTYNRWQTWVYSRKTRMTYAMLAVFSFNLLLTAMRLVRHNPIDALGWLAAGTMLVVVVLGIVILAWPLPPRNQHG